MKNPYKPGVLLLVWLCKNLGICQIPTLIFDKQEKQKKAQARLDICALSTRMIICIFMCF